MSKHYDEIEPAQIDWIRQQRIFFVATAPMSLDGHINVSPKGGDSFRVLGPREAAYLDYTGSGAETAAHLRENGRIVIMFCAFDGGPKIMRLHGRGRVLTEDDADFAEMASHFPDNPGTRSIVHIVVSRVSDSCGYAVPYFDFREERGALDLWAAKKGPAGLAEYREMKNRSSIDGLSAFLPQS